MTGAALHRRPRTWLPAAGCAVLFTSTLVGLQVLFHVRFEQQPVPGPDPTFIDWLLRLHVGFWGSGAFDTERTSLVVANAAGGVVLLLVVLLVAWIGLRGLAPGSSLVSAFLVLWAATLLAAPLARLTTTLVAYSDDLTSSAAGQMIAGATLGAVFALKWGWPAALVAAIWWRVATSHLTDATDTADGAGDSLPGGTSSDAGPGAPMQSRSLRAPDAPGEAAAEGPGRQPR